VTQKLPRDERVDALLRAAMEEFLEKGYDGSSMDAVAARAGLTKGGLYHHFRSKEDLLIAVHDRLMEPIVALLDRASEEPRAVDGLRRFISGYIGLCDSVSELAVETLGVAKGLMTPSWHSSFGDHARMMEQRLAALYGRAIEEGDLAVTTPADVALALLGALEGLEVYVTMSEAVPAARAEALLLDVFVDHYRP